MTAAAYLRQLQALLPPGPAWPTEDGLNLTALLKGLAEEFARVDGRATDLIAEFDPRTTVEMLDDWERVLGLPDECTGPADTLQERRDAIVQRLISTGGQSIAYFLEVAESLGYEGVTVDEFFPFQCGVSSCGQDHLNGGAAVRYNWRVNVPGARLTRFRCGSSRLGERLLDIDQAEDLSCLLGRLKPAHTNLIFSYTGV